MIPVLSRSVGAGLLLIVLQNPTPFETPIVGGVGGALFIDRCAPNEVMAGVSALLSGTDVGSIAIICQPVASNGTLGPAGFPHLRHGGAATGTATVAQCPRGQVLRGMAVYYGDAIRGLGLYCRVWATSAFGAVGGASETIGTAGAAMSPVTCPPEGSQPAVGVAGTATTRIVAVRLICDAPKR